MIPCVLASNVFRLTGSPPPVRVLVTEATSALPVSLAIQASTVNGEPHTHARTRAHLRAHIHNNTQTLECIDDDCSFIILFDLPQNETIM